MIEYDRIGGSKGGDGKDSEKSSKDVVSDTGSESVGEGSAKISSSVVASEVEVKKTEVIESVVDASASGKEAAAETIVEASAGKDGGEASASKDGSETSAGGKRSVATVGGEKDKNNTTIIENKPTSKYKHLDHILV